MTKISHISWGVTTKAFTVHTKEEVLEYTQKQLAIKMPYDKPQWEFIYVEDFNEKESLCFFKFHHSFSDGAGIINSTLFMNNADHISQEMFSGRGIPFYLKFLSGLLYPIWLILYAFVHYRPKWKGYEKIKTKTGENTGENIWIASKWYKLGDIKKWYKRFKGAKLIIHIIFIKIFTKILNLKKANVNSF